VLDRSVTVVIPTLDRPDQLGVTLATVLAQRDVDVRVVVVDDGSRVPVAIDHPSVTVVRHDSPRGVAASRNAGLVLATTPWVAFTDDDDLWAPGKLAAQLAAIAATPDARWSCVGVIQVDEDLSPIGRAQGPGSGDIADTMLSRNAIPGGGSGVLASTALVRDAGGFDEAFGMCADYDLWIRLAIASPIAVANEPLLAYVVHPGAMSRRLEDVYEELDRLDDKHHAERERRRLASGGSIHMWIGDRNQRAGRRIAAARAYLRGADAIGGAVALFRALEALVWPGAYRHRDHRRAEDIPGDWIVPFNTWLDPIRVGAVRHRSEPAAERVASA